MDTDTGKGEDMNWREGQWGNKDIYVILQSIKNIFGYQAL